MTMTLAEFKKYTDSVERVLEYILESENEDFYENPSNNHVYYYALVAWHGEEYAIEEVLSAKALLNEVRQ